MRARRSVPRALLLVTIAFAVSAPLVAQESVDLDVVHRIRQEALQNSQVMEHLFYLTDVSGSRLTNSPGFFTAADWVVKQLGEWGISAHQEKWGPFGRGWTYSRFSAQMLAPQSVPLIGAPLAYTPGTNGPVAGEPMIVGIASEADFAKYKGTLRGRIVLLGRGRNLEMSLQPLASRLSDGELGTLLQAPGPNTNAQRPPGTAAIGNGRQGGPGGANQQFVRALNKFLADEGVAIAVRPAGGRSEGGVLFAQGGGSRDPKDPVPPPMVVLTPEHYNRIARL